MRRNHHLHDAIKASGFEARARALRDEAAKAGDLMMVHICDRALEHVHEDSLDCMKVAAALLERGAA